MYIYTLQSILGTRRFRPVVGWTPGDGNDTDCLTTCWRFSTCSNFLVSSLAANYQKISARSAQHISVSTLKSLRKANSKKPGFLENYALCFSVAILVCGLQDGVPAMVYTGCESDGSRKCQELSSGFAVSKAMRGPSVNMVSTFPAKNALFFRVFSNATLHSLQRFFYFAKKFRRMASRRSKPVDMPVAVQRDHRSRLYIHRLTPSPFQPFTRPRQLPLP